MSLTPSMASGKPIMPTRHRPILQEGHYIRYRLCLAGTKPAAVARALNLDRSTISKVLCGLRRSARIEAEIARILGKADWNEVVLEARSEIQKKPVAVILNEMQRAKEARPKTAREAPADYISRRKEELDIIDCRSHRQRRGA